MNQLSEQLEQELTDAVEVKNPKSLHRYVELLTQGLVHRDTHETSVDRLIKSIRSVVHEMRVGFKRMDERFESMQHSMDKRFESMQESMDKRFESMDKRFEVVQHAMEKRFDAVDKRFDEQYRFTEARFQDMNRRFNMMFAFITIGFSIVSLVTVFLRIT